MNNLKYPFRVREIGQKYGFEVCWICQDEKHLRNVVNVLARHQHYNLENKTTTKSFQDIAFEFLSRGNYQFKVEPL